MINEQLENKNNNFGEVTDTVRYALMDGLNDHMVRYHESVEGTGPYGYQLQSSFATLMVLARVMDDTFNTALDNLYNITHYYSYPVDDYITKLQDFLGVELNQTTAEIELAFPGL
ncbi:unnamed protein product, partial [marine sediment metagenome]